MRNESGYRGTAGEAPLEQMWEETAARLASERAAREADLTDAAEGEPTTVFDVVGAKTRTLNEHRAVVREQLAWARCGNGRTASGALKNAIRMINILRLESEKETRHTAEREMLADAAYALCLEAEGACR